MRFRSLDGWRGFAAILVALFHAGFYGHLYAWPFIRHAYLLVDFFFVLSGFVITYAYADRLTAPEEYSSFIVRRFGRLWPLHATMLLVFFISELFKLAAHSHGGIATEHPPFSGYFTMSAFVKNIFLVHALGTCDRETWNGPSWSISVEFYTYFVFLIVFACFRRRLVTVSMLIAALSGFIIWRFSPHTPAIDTMYDFGFFRCLYGFFVGLLVYRIYARLTLRKWTIPYPAFTELLALGLMIMFIVLAGAAKLSLAAPLVFGVTVLVFSFESGPLSKLLSSTPFSYFGTWSYSIYMCHMFLWQTITRATKFADKAFGTPVFQQSKVAGLIVYSVRSPHSLYWMDLLDILYLAVVIAVACFMYRFVEEPSRKFFNRLSTRFETRVKNFMAGPAITAAAKYTSRLNAVRAPGRSVL
jgi:peptidoglycan/LPS O-acetylase OafA/YrhL